MAGFDVAPSPAVGADGAPPVLPPPGPDMPPMAVLPAAGPTWVLAAGAVFSGCGMMPAVVLLLGEAPEFGPLTGPSEVDGWTALLFASQAASESAATAVKTDTKKRIKTGCKFMAGPTM